MRQSLRIEPSGKLAGRPMDDPRAERLLVAQHLFGRRLHVPDDAEPGQHLQDVIGHVDFPPAKTLSHAALVGVVIVVPALTEGEQRQQPVVAGIVAGHVPLASMHMGEGIDAERRVIDQHGAPQEADDEAGPSGNQEAEPRQRNGRQEFQPMQPHQLRIGGEIADLHEVGPVVLPVKNPAEMTVEKAPVTRRMHVVFGVGMEMMVSMLGRPPQNAFLRGALGEPGQDELKHPAGRKSPMGEIAVIACSDGKHAHDIQ
ncbi:hypothetical protein ACVWWG_001559 [Bradyrhizobium sp. LB7.2]